MLTVGAKSPAKAYFRLDVRASQHVVWKHDALEPLARGLGGRLAWSQMKQKSGLQFTGMPHPADR